MNVDINYLAVLLAGLSSMVVGSLWYMPATFGKAWMKYTGVKMDKRPKPQQMIWIYGTVLVASLVTAYILAHVSFLANKFFGNSFLSDSLQTGFWLWLGFTAARIYVHDSFEMRRKKLTLLNAAHELVTVLVMALIIGLMKP
ncbi:MAG TPA: DUF1761 domain-containing protein [Candidatus Saccharimonadales bacterium]|nr:DUF1761 domain-containing protein [Candidatus Saccharimonadales bacterium]